MSEGERERADCRNNLRGMDQYTGFKSTLFTLPETSPSRYNFTNSFLISPTLDTKSRHFLTTPKRDYSTPIDLNLESPYYPNIIGTLKHDEKSSSFKRIHFNHFPNDILNGRSINFEGDSDFVKKIEYRENKIDSHQPNSNGFFKKYNMDFSSEGEESFEEKDSSMSCQKNQKKKLCCTCTKSRCLKKYCECFANGEYCHGCECLNCYNIPKFKELIQRSLEYSANEENEDEKKNEILCNCTKSNCTKKYCECYKAGEGCKELCRCINCENDKKDLSKNKKHDTPVDKEKIREAKNPLNFILEQTSVFVCNQDISITFRREVLNKKPIEENSGGVTKNSKIFEINPNIETPNMNRKRKRISKDDSISKSSCTTFQTPLFATTTSQKHTKKKVELDKHIVKKLY